MKKIIFIAFVFAIFLGFIRLSFAATKDLTGQYKILIVPGHDSDKWGSEFLGVKEANLNLKLAGLIAGKFKKNSHFEADVLRDKNGYLPDFQIYFDQNKDRINEQRKNLIESANQAKEDGAFKELTDGAPHATANPDVALRLYVVNDYADEKNYDAVLHIHFNDNPRKSMKKRGEYRGFSVYFPEAHLKNGELGYQLGNFIFREMNKSYSVSNYPPESLGLVPEQKLIAVGANDSLGAPSALVEYGYIYESRFSTFSKRDKEFKNMAAVTYKGILNYFLFRETK